MLAPRQPWELDGLYRLYDLDFLWMNCQMITKLKQWDVIADPTLCKATVPEQKPGNLSEKSVSGSVILRRSEALKSKQRPHRTAVATGEQTTWYVGTLKKISFTVLRNSSWQNNRQNNQLINQSTEEFSWENNRENQVKEKWWKYSSINPSETHCVVVLWCFTCA